jgi:hypothetical protein
MNINASTGIPLAIWAAQALFAVIMIAAARFNSRKVMILVETAPAPFVEPICSLDWDPVQSRTKEIPFVPMAELWAIPIKPWHAGARQEGN